RPSRGMREEEWRSAAVDMGGGLGWWWMLRWLARRCRRGTRRPLRHLALSWNVPIRTLASRAHPGLLAFLAGHPFVLAPLAAVARQLHLRHDRHDIPSSNTRQGSP